MPFTRPDVISDSVSLSDKLTRPVRGFIPKDGAIDTLLAAVVDEPTPDEHGVSVSGSEHDAFSRSDELASTAAVTIAVAGVMAFIEFKARAVAVLGQIPKRLAHSCSLPHDVPMLEHLENTA